MKKKPWIRRLKTYLEEVAAWTFFLVGGLIFVIAAAVTLTFVYFYTRR